MARATFVHGAGRSGAAAWPRQQALQGEADVVFVERFGFGAAEFGRPTDFAEDRRRIVEALGEGAHLVAHSYGAIGALMAAAASPELVETIVLFEPACLSLARGRPAVERHVEIVQPALADAALSDEEFLDRFMASVGKPAPIRSLSDQARDDVRRLRAQRGPWEAELDGRVVATHRTLCVTSGASELSEDVAAALTDLGARHVVWARTGHRPQDDRRANAFLRAVWSGGG